jgi:hypothetical protein
VWAPPASAANRRQGGDVVADWAWTGSGPNTIVGDSMALMAAFTPNELAIIGECLKAIAAGPFLRDDNAANPWWEFRSVMGVEHHVVAAIAERWPQDGLDDRNVCLAAHNAMNNLLLYPHDRWDVWHAFISATPDEVDDVFVKLKALIGEDDRNSVSRNFKRLR